jgi:hypothetical protein
MKLVLLGIEAAGAPLSPTDWTDVACDTYPLDEADMEAASVL